METPVEVEILAPAKVNLSLKVTGKRPDGYHELVSVMAPISLFDRITLKKLGEAGKIEAKSVGSAHVEDGEKNLCHKAARFFFAETGVEGGVSIEVEKNIPVGAGLGGGSSDAASTILALSRLYGVELSEDSAARAGFAVGADVPFFFAGGPAQVGGIGEKVTPLKDMETLFLVILFPGAFLSTGEVFSRLNMGLTRKSSANTITCFNFQGIREALVNDLMAPALEAMPLIGEALEVLKAHGARAWLMSGSGSAVFGVFEDESRAGAAALRIRAGSPPGWKVEAVRTLTKASDFPTMKMRWGVGKR